MEPETYWFEAITRYDEETYKEFAKYHYRHVAPGLPFFLTVVGTMAFSWGIIQLFLEPDSWSVWPCIVGAVFLAIGVNQLLGRFGSNVKDPQDNRIRFFDGRVEYAGRQEQGVYRYDQVVRIRENQRYFFLYVAKNRAIMVDKAGMTLGTPDQLRGFLAQKTRPQYR